MTTISDGGPAFPVDPEVRRDEPHAGMTLRDYFAAQALPVVASGSYMANSNYINIKHYDSAAEDAYRMADAMLAARGAQ